MTDLIITFIQTALEQREHQLGEVDEARLCLFR